VTSNPKENLFDPQHFQSINLYHLVSQGLFSARYEKNKLVIDPALASSWQIIEPKTLKITLKNDLRKSDGSNLTADDFIDAWRSNLSSKELTLARPLFPIFLAREFFEGKVPFSKVGIKSAEPNTLLLNLNESPETFIWSLAEPSLALQPTRSNKERSVGPFKFETHSQRDKFTLVRNPFYWNTKSPITKIDIQILRHPLLAYNMLEDKEIDLVISDSRQPLLQTKSLHFYPTHTKAVLLLDTEDETKKTAQLGHKLIQAVNPSEFPKLLGTSWFPTITLDSYFASPLEGESYSKKTPKETLTAEEAQSIPLYYVKEFEPLAQLLQMQWLKERSIHTKLNAISLSQLKSWNNTPKPKVFLLPVKLNPLYPTSVIDNLQHQARLIGVANTSNELTKAKSEILSSKLKTVEKHHKLFQEIEQRLIRDYGLYLPLTQQTIAAYHSSQLTGIKPSPMGGLDLSEITF
jgi:ABC-type transport system substrate-binding protein